MNWSLFIIKSDQTFLQDSLCICVKIKELFQTNRGGSTSSVCAWHHHYYYYQIPAFSGLFWHESCNQLQGHWGAEFLPLWSSKNSPHLPLKRKACSFHMCAPFIPIHPTAHAVTLAKICAAFRSITDAAHAVAMVMATLKGCREAFVLINGCKKRLDTRGRRGVTDVQ